MTTHNMRFHVGIITLFGKPHLSGDFLPKSIDIFLISQRKNMLWYSVEVPHRGTSNEYPQHVFIEK